jgi:bifunctional DNA-binding transcriptional regulator/antitoxin component of YhaV-PrlF toxin-antitoxin module
MSPTKELPVPDVLSVGSNGQVTIPIGFRKGHGLNKGGKVAAIQMGDALVLVPHDEVMESIFLRMEGAMKAAGLTVEDLQAAALEERERLVQERYGHLFQKGKRNAAR